MGTLTIVPLAEAATPAVEPLTSAAGSGSVARTPAADPSARRFSGALDRAMQQEAAAGVSPAPEAGARDRVRRSLELDASRPAEAGQNGPGDAILDGLQKLRGAFDAGQSRISEVIKGSAVDSRTLLAMQMEMVNYSLLVDVTSKLTGKSTQSFDSLMKGQ